MKTLIKGTFILVSSIFLLLATLLLFDMADYDSSYVNRNSLVIDVKNLNSRHSHRIIFLLRKHFVNYSIKISKKYSQRWEVENEEERLKLPEYKIIPKKTANFRNLLMKAKITKIILTG